VEQEPDHAAVMKTRQCF